MELSYNFVNEGLPEFFGENPFGWIIKAERFFREQEIHSFDKVQWACMRMNGIALVWFHSWCQEDLGADWGTFSIAFLRWFRKGNYGGAVEEQLTEEGEIIPQASGEKREEQLTEEGEIIPQASGEKRNVENPDGEANGFEGQTFYFRVNHTIETSNKRRGPNTRQFEQSHHLTVPLVATPSLPKLLVAALLATVPPKPVPPDIRPFAPYHELPMTKATWTSTMGELNTPMTATKCDYCWSDLLIFYGLINFVFDRGKFPSSDLRTSLFFKTVAMLGPSMGGCFK